jgi:hypothetical protein
MHMAVLRCIAPFAVTDEDGVSLVFTDGMLVDVKNRWVKGRELMFEEVEVTVERQARVEAETAAPGAKRGRKAADKG